MKNTGGPAFPKTPFIEIGTPQNGMSMRDYFAARAMQSLMNNFLAKGLDMEDPTGWMDGLSGDAYLMADAMLRAREE